MDIVLNMLCWFYIKFWRRKNKHAVFAFMFFLSQRLTFRSLVCTLWGVVCWRRIIMSETIFKKSKSSCAHFLSNILSVLCTYVYSIYISFLHFTCCTVVHIFWFLNMEMFWSTCCDLWIMPYDYKWERNSEWFELCLFILFRFYDLIFTVFHVDITYSRHRQYRRDCKRCVNNISFWKLSFSVL